MPEENISEEIQDLVIKREDAVVAYRRAKLTLAEAHAEVVRESLRTGEFTMIDGGAECW